MQDGAQQSAPAPPDAEQLDAARPPPVRLRAFSWARRLGDAAQGSPAPLGVPPPGLGARSAGASAASPAVTPRRCSCPGNLPPPHAGSNPNLDMHNPFPGARGDADGGASHAPGALPAGFLHPLSNPASAATSARSPSGSLLDDDTGVPPGFRSCPSPGRSPAASPRAAGHGKHRLSSHALASYDSSAPASPSPPTSTPLNPAAGARGAGLASFGSLLEYAPQVSANGAAQARGAAAANCSLDDGALKGGAVLSGRGVGASCSLDAGAQGPGLGRCGGAPAAGCSLNAGAPGIGLGLSDRAAAYAHGERQADAEPVGSALGAHARTASAPDLDGWDMAAWDAPPAVDPGSGAAAAPADMLPSLFAVEASGAKAVDSPGTGRVLEPESGAGSDGHSALTTLESWGSFEVPEAEHGTSGSGGMERGLGFSRGDGSRQGSVPDACVSRLGPGRCAGAPHPAGGSATCSSAAQDGSESLSQRLDGGTQQLSGFQPAACMEPGGGRARLGSGGTKGARSARGRGVEVGQGRLAAWEAAQLSSFARRPG